MLNTSTVRTPTVRIITGALFLLIVLVALPGDLDMDQMRTVGLLLAALGQTSFVLLYMTFPWWKRFLGRALFFKACALGLLADVAIAGRVWDWTYEEQTFIALYWLLALGVWAQFGAFLHIRLHKRQNYVSGNRGDL